MSTAENLETSSSSSNELIEGFTSLNLVRQAGLMVGLAASVAIGFAVVLWTQGEDYKALYQGLDRMDAVEIGNLLEANEIPYKIDLKSGQLCFTSTPYIGQSGQTMYT